ncbi:MAG TPA: hypothetical protein VEY67_02000 [Candidatus Dormibacteraeota bacterium]|nr:hypothetical protein [Candidatus Dormibacteraeota bacterium]
MSVRAPGVGPRHARLEPTPPWLEQPPEPVPPGLELVPVRRYLVGPLAAWFELAAGDRPLVAPGEAVIAGTPIAERLRDPRLAELPTRDDDHRRPGDRLSDAGERKLRRAAVAAGELVFRSGRRWRVATGDLADPLESPGAGIVREVRPGTGIVLELAGAAIPGVLAIGVPARGALSIVGDPSAELHPAGLDVGRAGTILVVGPRVDAETLTRARAMGVKGVVVAGVSGKEVRDFRASEARQRAAIHGLPAFALLVLDGVLRRPLAGPVQELLRSLEGHDVGIVTDPPALVIDGGPPALPPPPPAWIRVRHGPHAGEEGWWAGAVGPRRFPPGVHLEAALVAIGDGPPTALPIADLERFA